MKYVLLKDSIKSRMQHILDAVHIEILYLTRVCIFGCRYLDRNNFTGPIPDNIGNLTNLKNLWASFGVRNWRDSISRPHTMEKILGWRDFKIKSRMQRILHVVNFEFDTEPNPFTYIWMQIPFWQPTHGPHPKKHREFDESSKLVSPIWCEKWDGCSHEASHPLEKIHGYF